jgi:hypothetical protein
LYKAITGGVDWGELSDLLDEISPMLGFVFLGYNAFAVLVLLNLVTGLFVDGAINLNTSDRAHDLLQKVHQTFRKIDHDDSGSISQTEFVQASRLPEMQDLLVSLDIDPTSAETVFKYLDRDGGGTLSAEEFAKGAFDLQSPAKALDVAVISMEMRMLMAKLDPHGEHGKKKHIKASKTKRMTTSAAPRATRCD